MKPDFIKVKIHCENYLMSYLEKKIHESMGVLFSSPKYIVHEGAQHGFLRRNGKDDSSELKEVQVSGSMEKIKLEIGDQNEVIKFLDNLAQQKGQDIQKMAYQSINQSCDENGQTVSTEGLSLKETIVKMFNSIQIEFNEDGTPQTPQLLCGPALFEKIKTQNEDDKAFIEKEIQKILEIKKLEWNERENNRKLVI